MDGGRFPKREHICSTRLIDQLFGSGSQWMAAYPLRAVFHKTDRQQTSVPVQVLISVPKKHFKHAVDRNRVKRQVREGYRLNKKALETLVTEHLKPNSQLLIAFIWIDDKLHPSKEVHMKVRSLMEHIAERVIKRETLKAEQP